MTKREIHIGTAGSLNEVGKTYDNVFDALDMPYEAAVTRIWELGAPEINPDFEAFKKAVDIIRQVVEADREQRIK